MKQISFETEFSRQTRRTRKREFLDQMDRVVPWAQLVQLIAPHMPSAGAKGGRPPFGVETMLRIHFLQQWFTLSDPAMEEALHDVPLFREFARLDAGDDRLPDESTILRFRHRLERKDLSAQIFALVNTLLIEKGLMLKSGTVVDATLIAAPSSTKNQRKERDPQMQQTRKGQQYYFGMKAHIGVDAQSGLVHTVVGTAANAHDVTQAGELLHGEETEVHADSGYRGVQKRPEIIEHHPQVQWQISMMHSKRRALLKDEGLGALLNQIEKLKSGVRAKVEHAFRILKCQFGHRKVRYRGLKKNTHQLYTLFALGNLWMVRGRLDQGLKG
jgi:transposase, IS5 family